MTKEHCLSEKSQQSIEVDEKEREREGEGAEGEKKRSVFTHAEEHPSTVSLLQL